MENNSDTENVIIPGFITGEKNTPTVYIPRLTDMLVMSIKIPLLLHQGHLLLENKQSWVSYGIDTCVLTPASLTSSPKPNHRTA